MGYIVFEMAGFQHLMDNVAQSSNGVSLDL